MHPLQVSSVLYVVQRMQTMATLFLVLALLAYLKARLAQIEGRAGRNGLAADNGALAAGGWLQGRRDPAARLRAGAWN